MIKINLQGQLGNQMFQYAAGTSFAIENRVKFELVSTAGSKFIVSKYFKLPSHHKSDFKYKLEFYKAKIKKHLNIRNQDLIELSQNDTVDENLSKLKDKKHYSGFFQSMRYFSHNITTIQQEFQLKTNHLFDFQKKYGALFSNHETLAVHIRKGDYTTFGSKEKGGADLSLPMKYYIKGIDSLQNEKTKVIIVSDDITLCKKHLPNSHNYIFSDSSEIIDFQILLNADKIVISNSSFSWWAAALNLKKNKKIIAPQYWLGHLVKEEYPKGISHYLDYQWIEAS